MLTDTCPHCFGTVIIEQVNCGIFRHAALKTTGQQISPHSSKQECEKLIQENKIWGCGKPFKIQKDQNDVKLVKCDYI